MPAVIEEFRDKTRKGRPGSLEGKAGKKTQTHTQK